MLINQKLLDFQANAFAKEYLGRAPFPNIAIDDFLSESAAREIINSFPNVTDKIWTHYVHYNERKHGLTKWEHLPIPVQNLVTEMSQPKFISWLEKLTGIDGLFADPNLEGSGLHQTLPGGFLNIHADFTVHPLKRNWQRRVNVLLYLNEDWNESWGGQLELWDETMQNCTQKIAPFFNRAAIFTTSTTSFHGYPNAVTCPEGVSRKSLAMYFYTEEENPVKSATSYKPRPTDGFKSLFIWGDTQLISLYSYLKGKFGLNDDFISSILNIFTTKKSK